LVAGFDRFLVALAALRDLLIGANYLRVPAIECGDNEPTHQFE
jgi:hypothetical protein